MKILFLQDDFPPQSFGGAGISTYELALGMRKAGNEVFVITTCRKESEAGISNYQGLKVFKITSDYSDKWRNYLSLYNPFVIYQVKKILKEVEPDIVHINNIHTHLSYHCFKIAKKYSKVVIFTARDVMTFNFAKLETKRYLENFDYHTIWFDHLKQAKKRWNPFRNFCIKKYLKYAGKVFAISRSLQEALRQNGITDVEVIYNGIDIDDWNVESEAIARFRKKYHLFDRKVLLFSGRLSTAKGGGKTIEALAQIATKVPEVVLLVAGSVDENAEAMKEQAKSLGVGENLIFTGWIEREEIKIAYAVADIVLMPSICLDVFGRVNIEAMVSRKPVVGTCYGGTPEIVVDGVTGYIVNPLHPEEIAEKVIDLLEDPKKAEEFGQAGYDRVKTKFNLKDKVEEYLVVYRKLLEKKVD
jgi:glycosyltransferase involved in cell wall biosynthesis